MSFAGETKKELCKSILRLDKCCKFAVLYGILLFGNKFSVNEIKIVTEKDFIKETVYIRPSFFHHREWEKRRC